MFREKFIARVPESTIESANFITRRWQRVFNIACWVRFHSPKPNTVSLILHFTDDEGTKEAVIDSCGVELEQNVLLSNHITLEGKGKVKEMSLYLRATDKNSPYVIDELYIQSCEQGAIQQPKIISVA